MILCSADAEHQWLFVQFPGVLPALDRKELSKESSSKVTLSMTPVLHHEAIKSSLFPAVPAVDDSYCATTLEGLPEGRLGSLKIHKSGKVVFVIGNHQFEVHQGSDCNFSQVFETLCRHSVFPLQEVASLILSNSELMFLGRCNKRIVVTPDLSQI